MESLFFLDRPAKLADEIAQFVVFAVSIGEEVGALHVEGAFLVDETLVGLDIDDIGDEHIVATEGEDLFHAAFDAERRLGDSRRIDDRGFTRREVHFLEFMMCLAGIDAAPVGRESQVAGRQVDDKFHRTLQDGVRMPFRADGNIAHRRISANRTDPSHCDDVKLLRRGAARDHDGGQGVNHGAGFPVELHKKNFLEKNFFN